MWMELDYGYVNCILSIWTYELGYNHFVLKETIWHHVTIPTLVDFSAALARLAFHKVYSQRITSNLPVQYRDQLSLKERFYRDTPSLDCVGSGFKHARYNIMCRRVRCVSMELLNFFGWYSLCVRYTIHFIPLDILQHSTPVMITWPNILLNQLQYSIRTQHACCVHTQTCRYNLSQFYTSIQYMVYGKEIRLTRRTSTFRLNHPE